MIPPPPSPPSSSTPPPPPPPRPRPPPPRPGWREHRTVCLPDFQGLGLGSAMSNFIAAVYRSTNKPYFSPTSHPALIRPRARSPLWRLTRKPGMKTDHHHGLATHSSLG